MVLSTQYWD